MISIGIITVRRAKDVLWLRVLPILASMIGLPYFYLQPTVLWEPLVWAVLFMTINAYHVWRLWMERRPVELSSDEARLYDLTFFPLSARQFVELARLGRWTDQKAGDVLLRSDEPIGELAVPLTESVDATVAGRHFGRFPAGAIIGASALSIRACHSWRLLLEKAAASCGYRSPR